MSSEHHSASAHDFNDHAPGEEYHGHSGVAEGIRGYLLGLILASGLTVASFAVTKFGLYGPGVPVALLVFAVAQMGVHLVFFLHITTGPDNTNNVMALLFGIFIVILVVIGSVWIMAHMNANMMPSTMSGMGTGGAMQHNGLVQPVPTQAMSATPQPQPVAQP